MITKSPGFKTSDEALHADLESDLIFHGAAVISILRATGRKPRKAKAKAGPRRVKVKVHPSTDDPAER